MHDSDTGGLVGNSTKLATKAFADDLVQTEDNSAAIILLLGNKEKFLSLGEMHKLFVGHPQNTKLFKMRPSDIYTIWSGEILAILALNPARWSIYMGHTTAPTEILKPTIFHIKVWLYNLERAPLKPIEKHFHHKETYHP